MTEGKSVAKIEGYYTENNLNSVRLGIQSSPPRISCGTGFARF